MYRVAEKNIKNQLDQIMEKHEWKHYSKQMLADAKERITW
jgi:hypothetical protein